MYPGDLGLNIHGSLKKRIAPPPPPITTTPLSGNGGCGMLTAHYGTLPTSSTLAPSSSSHSRTTSEPILAGQGLHTGTLYRDFIDKSSSSTLQRPRNPPPPAPPPPPSSVLPSSSRLSNGRSSESLSSMCSEHGIGNPVPPPRKVNFIFIFSFK